jgi:hypothetical protein
MAGISTFTGTWTNWDHGPIRGQVVTMKDQYGGPLAAFLALFVSFAGGMFWRLVSHSLHQLHTTDHGSTRGWLHQKQQVILRNSGSSSGSASWGLLRLAFGPAGSKSKSTLRCLLYALLALGILLLFSVAGIFTSSVTKVPGNFTVVLGPACGGYATRYGDSNVVDPSMTTKIVGDSTQAATYVQQCYQNDASDLACGTFVQPRIPFTTTQNVSCPFESGYCKMGDTAAFSMDTGRLDSRTYFGINAAPKDRVLFRRLTTCAPIEGSSFGVNRNTSDFGRVVYVEAGYALNDNYTFMWEVDEGYTKGYDLQYVCPVRPDVVSNNILGRSTRRSPHST